MQSIVDHTEIAERPSGVAVEPAVTLPEDVREWVDPCTLSLWVQDEVQAHRLPRPLTAPLSAETTEVLEVLTFAYASGVLASEEIAAACKSNPAFRFLSQGHTYFAEELTSFRRRFRGELEVLLTRTDIPGRSSICPGT